MLVSTLDKVLTYNALRTKSKRRIEFIYMDPLIDIMNFIE